MELTFKNLADIIIAVTDPIETIDYNFNTIEELLDCLYEHGNRKITLRTGDD